MAPIEIAGLVRQGFASVAGLPHTDMEMSSADVGTNQFGVHGEIETSDLDVALEQLERKARLIGEVLGRKVKEEKIERTFKLKLPETETLLLVQDGPIRFIAQYYYPTYPYGIVYRFDVIGTVG